MCSGGLWLGTVKTRFNNDSKHAFPLIATIRLIIRCFKIFCGCCCIVYLSVLDAVYNSVVFYFPGAHVSLSFLLWQVFVRQLHPEIKS